MHFELDSTMDNRQTYSDTFGFDIALQRLKLGHKVTRAIWNNPDVFLTINHRGKDIPVSELWSTKIREQLVANGTKKVKVQGNIMMLRQDGTIGMYEPNTEDVLAEDWIMLD